MSDRSKAVGEQREQPRRDPHQALSEGVTDYYTRQAAAEAAAAGKPEEQR